MYAFTILRNITILRNKNNHNLLFYYSLFFSDVLILRHSILDSQHPTVLFLRTNVLL